MCPASSCSPSYHHYARLSKTLGNTNPAKQSTAEKPPRFHFQNGAPTSKNMVKKLRAHHVFLMNATHFWEVRG